jgi:hypothetical protein
MSDMLVSADQIDRMIGLQKLAEDLAAGYAKRSDRVDNTILVLSVVTSGALWAIAADVLPKPLRFAGAAISTVITILTIYMPTSGLRKKRKKAVVLHSEITRFLGRMRGQWVEHDEFWNTYKSFEAQLATLRYAQED